MKLSRPVTVGKWTIRGVDDWLAFCTDADGNWFQFQTECSTCWPMLPREFIGACGYPDTDEGVLATAMLEANSGIEPRPCNPEYVAELATLFGGTDVPRTVVKIHFAAAAS